MHVNSTAMWQDKRRFFKFLVCFIGGLILTKLIGYPNVMTISATGLLVINSDRGEMGSRHYMLRRTITNLLCAVLGANAAIVIVICAVLGIVFARRAER